MGDRTDELAKIFKALSDPNRLEIFRLLRKRCGAGCRVARDESDNTVSALAEEFDLALSTVSHHIKELKNAGLITCKKQGLWVHCAPDDSVLRKIEAFVRG